MDNITYINLERYKFKDINLLQIALTHPSSTKKKNINYERMEFLGDSVLNLIITDTVYHKFYYYNEGGLSTALANLINSKIIVKIATKLKINAKIIFDNKKIRYNAKSNSNHLENTLESIIAAIYLDSNFITIKNLIITWWAEFFIDMNKLFKKDYKSQLQELFQKKYKILPSYKMECQQSKFGKLIFIASILLKNQYKFQAQGDTRKEAEQKVAEKILKFIQNNE